MLAAADALIQQTSHHHEEETDDMSLARNELIEQVKLTIISHPYLDDMLDKIRATEIPWEDYKNTGLITADEVAMIKHVEDKNVDDLGPIMSEVIFLVPESWTTTKINNLLLCSMACTMLHCTLNWCKN